jgi:uncharacterized protein YggU (UPF0235/DUF167 family)
MRSRGIIIELTSLLDVILIVLFLILVQSEQKVHIANAAATESISQTEQLTAELERQSTAYENLQSEFDGLKRTIVGQTVVADNTMVIAIHLQPAAQGRVITLQADDNDAVPILIDWTNQNYAANALHAALSEQVRLSEAQVVFIVFTYDRENIYQADYTLVRNAIQKQTQNPRVYTAEYDNYTKWGQP